MGSILTQYSNNLVNFICKWVYCRGDEIAKHLTEPFFHILTGRMTNFFYSGSSSFKVEKKTLMMCKGIHEEH